MKLAFSTLVTVVLLAIYVYLVVHGISVAQCLSDSACTEYAEADFNDRMASALALIGGLVAALVVAELSVTEPGKAPVARLVAPEVAEKRKRLLQIVTGLYLLVWLSTGLASFVFGYLLVDPDVLPAVGNIGQGWLGVAVGAGYAYLGIRQPKA
jgi:hypothetical protein